MAARSLTRPPKRGTASQRFIKAFKRDWQYYLLMLLPVAYIIIFAYVPILGLQIAFRKYTAAGGIWGSEWVGFDNFIKFFSSYQFERVVSNTVIISFYSLIVGTIFPVLFALVINSIDSVRFRKTSQTIVNLPHFISTVVLVGMLMQVFNSRSGIFGVIYHSITGEYAKDIFGQLDSFRHMYVWSGVWQNFGWSSIIYIAALTSIDPQLHEAAQIDGATRFQRMLNIDLPHIKPTVIILLTMGIGRIMSVGFEKAYLMQNSLNLKHSELISTYVFRVGLSGMQKSDFSYATAIDLFNAVINLILVLGANWFSRKVTGSGLW